MNFKDVELEIEQKVEVNLMKRISIAVLIALFTIGLVGFLIFILNKTVEPELVLSLDQLEVRAPYGITIRINEIKGVTLQDNIPEIVKKINGLHLD